MTIELGNTGSRIHESRIKLQYNWWLGKIAGRFYQEIRDRCKIWGIKCPQCNLVFVPPKDNCPKCFCKMNEWIELNGAGILTTYTIVRYPVPMIQPVKPPFPLGIIQLDGADTGLIHLLGEIDIDRIEVGMRMQAVFKEKREGNLLDIKYFRPVKQ